jgi:transposase
LADHKTLRRRGMTQPASSITPVLDYGVTIIGALELSGKSWVLAVQLPGVKRHSKHVLGPSCEDLVALIERLKARSLSTGHKIERVILTHEAGRDGFWLARFLERCGVEVHVMQPSSIPVDRRARRAKTDAIDVEMLLRTLMAWLRGEPRVCSMVPIPREADEEARRAHREREDLLCERRSIVNKMDGILATLGVKGFKALRRDRREQLRLLHQPGGDAIPQLARARLERLLERLELVLQQIAKVEKVRDAVFDKPAPENEAERMIRSLAKLRSIGADFATLLVREAFVRDFQNRRAVAGYAGLGGTPFSSGSIEREQGIGKDGNRRLRTAMVELAWLWLRWQPGSGLSAWFRRRTEQAGSRTKKIMIVALARKLLVALWRYVRDGVIPEGAEMKAA